MYKARNVIEGCKNGDAKAQASLFDLYKKRWMGVCVRYVKDIDEAQDIFQEAAIRIFKDIVKLKEVEAFDGWARKIMINQSLNHLRKKKVYVLMLQEYTDSKREPERPDIEVIRRMDNDELLRLINSLPDGYRIVLNLALVDGYKHADIAKLLSISESTSRSQLNKARRSLQRLIGNYKLKENARIAG
jgi:RNA polymerase sigma factor (sigma-70 family)